MFQKLQRLTLIQLILSQFVTLNIISPLYERHIFPLKQHSDNFQVYWMIRDLLVNVIHLQSLFCYKYGCAQTFLRPLG